MRLFTPPVVAILMTSTPRAIWRRTARRQSSAPSQVDPPARKVVVKFVAHAERRIGMAGRRGNGGAGVDDARPDRPAAADRVAKPEGDAVLGAEVAHRGEARVQRLARVPCRFVGPQRDAVGKAGHEAFIAGPVAVRWTWLSISPGSTKRSRRSTTRAPAGGSTKPSTTRSIRPSRIRMLALRRGGRPGRSSRVPAWMIVTPGSPGSAWAAAGRRRRDRRVLGRQRSGGEPEGQKRTERQKSAHDG